MNRYLLLVLHTGSLVLLGFGWTLNILQIDISIHFFSDINLFNEKRSVFGMLQRLWTDKSPLGRLARLGQTIFISRKVMALMYPAPPDSWRILLYYPVRVKDILRRHGRTAWHLYMGDERMRLRAERQNEVNDLRDWLLCGG